MQGVNLKKETRDFLNMLRYHIEVKPLTWRDFSSSELNKTRDFLWDLVKLEEDDASDEEIPF